MWDNVWSVVNAPRMSRPARLWERGLAIGVRESFIEYADEKDKKAELCPVSQFEVMQTRHLKGTDPLCWTLSRSRLFHPCPANTLDTLTFLPCRTSTVPKRARQT